MAKQIGKGRANQAQSETGYEVPDFNARNREHIDRTSFLHAAYLLPRARGAAIHSRRHRPLPSRGRQRIPRGAYERCAAMKSSTAARSLMADYSMVPDFDMPTTNDPTNAQD